MTDPTHMTSGVLAAVLAAAALHALWNSLVKSADDKFLFSGVVAIWCGAVALLAALVLPWPAGAAMPFIVASAIIHIVYFILVGLLYRKADLSVAYPIMRGLAPLIAAAIALATLGEKPGPIASLGVAALVAGVLGMGASGLAHGRIDRPTVIVAVANSAVIAIYSVIDGQGARVSGSGAAFAFAYNSWADALTAFAYLPIIVCLRGRAVIGAFARGWRLGLVGGLAAFLGYAIVIWAMTRAPIAAVAALRETSVVFAAIIGVVALREPFHAQRAIAALVILAGIVLLRIG
ncbi:MAG: EamA family transporter [Hyphomicrobiales bacterium]|nr:EamA family transporter [Hyphomicrobiales bacterium]